MKFTLYHFVLVLLCATTVSAQNLKAEFPESISVAVKNPIQKPREYVFVFMPLKDISPKAKKFNIHNFIVLDKGEEIPGQFANHNQVSGIIIVLEALGSGESRALEIRYHPEGKSSRQYVKRTQAELSHKVGGEFVNREYQGGTFQNVEFLRVPSEHKDHSWFIRYEGPGWESDKVGYRFYLDQRNATDVFGKTTSDMVLQQVGLDGFDSYHNMQPWGMDVMKVGKSLGLGSIGAMTGDSAIRVEKTDSVRCRITANGNIYSSIQTNYKGWRVQDKKYDVQSTLSIHAGTRLTLEKLTGVPPEICTGIVKDKAAKLLTSKGDNKRWAYLATYGKQSLNTDDLGLVIFINPKQLTRFTQDKYSHIAVLKPSGGETDYYFAAAWSQEPGGIQNETEFQQYIEKISMELANPVTVSIK